MSDDYRVDPRSDAEVRELARKARAEFGFANVSRLDPIACLNHDWIETAFGKKRLLFDARPDAELGEDDAFTSYGFLPDGRPYVQITVKDSVHQQARLGLGRARMTVAHELGHAIMHQGIRMARRTLGNLRYASIATYESAEHHARVFAAALLIHPKFAEELDSDEEISVQFGVSIEAARIYLQERRSKSARIEAGLRIRHFAKELREAGSPSKTIHFLDALCVVCSEKTLFAVGHKMMCRTCDTVFDRPQDGDPSFI
jgi:Zn-dependent peptidase ImmA (M78 family)